MEEHESRQGGDIGSTHDDSTSVPYDPARLEQALAHVDQSTRLDRYLLLERIGRGSFATVWAAYDPKLDRRVAIKLLHDGGDDLDRSESAAGLSDQLTEAQALAQLNHPNVVAIHDVQPYDLVAGGEHIAGVFIVMEFLAGASLREWMDEPHDWREVLAVFGDAGKGLAAAHERSLVHRDFKPSNVMFGADGRVRVLDFGLAKPGAEIRKTELERSSDNRSRVVGTPAYMAPEQHLDDEVDARSDQFAFCVALYEALYRQRPFVGDDRASLGKAKLRGEIQPAPRGAAVPAWVHTAVVRGLAADPEDRFPSMAALLEALARDPNLARKRWVVGAAVVIAVAGSGYGLARVADHRTPTPVACESPDRELAGVWDKTVRAEIRRSFDATELDYADEIFAQISLELDARTAQWAKLHREVCEATMVRNEQPVEVMAEQMLCLQRQLRRIAGLTSALVQVDATTVSRAADTVHALESPATCRTAVAERRRELPDEARKAELLAIEGEVARAGVLTDLGRYEEAITTAETAIAHAIELGDPGSVGRSALAQTRALWYLGRYDDALAASKKAVRYAAIVGDDETEAMAQIRMVRVYTSMGEYDVAEAVSMITGALVEDGRLGKDVEAWHCLYTAILYGRQRRWSDAIAMLDRGLKLRTEVYGPNHPELAAFHNTYGNTLLLQGEDDDGALAHYREALRLWETNFGPQYPDVAPVRNNLGAVYLDAHELDAARREFRLALEGFERTIGADNPQLISTILNLGTIAEQQGRMHDAIARFERARAIASAKLGESNVRTAAIDFALARAYFNIGQLARAERLLEQALAVQLEESPDDLTAIIRTLDQLAECQSERGDVDAWRATLERGRGLLGTRELHDDLTGWSVLVRAQFARQDGDTEAAIELAEQHLALLTEVQGASDPNIVASIPHLVDWLIDSGEIEAAAERAREALDQTSMDPNDRRRWALLFQLGRIERARGNTDAAIAALERAYELTSGEDGHPGRAAIVARELAPLIKPRDPDRADRLQKRASSQPEGQP